MSTLILFVGASALLGSAAGYSFLYVFHVIAVLVSVVFMGRVIALKKFRFNEYSLGLLFFYTFSGLSVFWVENAEFFLRNMFYLTCGLVIVLAIGGAAQDQSDILRLQRMVLLVCGIQIIIGVLEALGVFRLPVSPYSEYYYLFGRDNSYLHQLPEAVLEYNLSKPTGFFSNPNTFGFALLLFAPFFCFGLSRFFRIVSFVAILYLVYAIDSRSVFVFFLLMCFIYAFFWARVYLFLLVPLFVVAVVVIAGFDFNFSGRMFTVLSEALRGISLLFNGVDSTAFLSSDVDSTGYRAGLYAFGISMFVSNPLGGLGFGGVEHALSVVVGDHVALHNFYLQVLADLGVVGFMIYAWFYFYLLRCLYSASLFFGCSRLGVISRCLFVSLSVAVFSSITPSGIMYNLTYWFFIGFSAAICAYYKKICRL